MSWRAVAQVADAARCVVPDPPFLGAHDRANGAGPEAPSILIASWNAEWLSAPAALTAAGFWSRCAETGWPNRRLEDSLPFCDVYARRGIFDGQSYEARKLVPVRSALARMAGERVDIVALQEVAGREALDAVLPAGYRVACGTSRPDPQNLAFVVRDDAGLTLSCGEAPAFSLESDSEAPHPLRRGLELTVTTAGRTVVLLNVHLKAGCASGPMDRRSSPHCRLLRRQVPILEDWMEASAREGRSFLVIGDWNRDLEAEVRGRHPARTDGSDPAAPLLSPDTVRNLFPEIADGRPDGSAVDLAAVDRGVAANGACHGVLDQIVASRRLIASLLPASLVAGQLPARLVLEPDGASDHCSLYTRLVWR